METLRIKVRDRKTRTLLRKLEQEGSIEVVKSTPQEVLADVMRAMRASVKEKLTTEEVIAEVEQVRAKRHEAAKKTPARR
jgi:hypothetical protein